MSLCGLWFCLCFCFFSSRRRHTRLQGDWSSDVCSSDLSSCEADLQVCPRSPQVQARRMLGMREVFETGYDNAKFFEGALWAPVLRDRVRRCGPCGRSKSL